MGHLFISYSHTDKEYVHQLADALQAEGFEVWIDDRIDYGTRWPLVIETAIDACDSFILVASENSHQSEWVQHEVARAQRLSKQIFPLLLSGNAWISFEATQYFDVRDENLPSKKFYDALHNSENRRFEWFCEFVRGIWPVYHNEEYGFSVSYPPKSNLLEGQDGSVRIELPVLDGTNLKEKTLLIHFKNDGILSSPALKDLPWINRRTYIDMRGLKFLKESGHDNAMHRLHEWISYSTISQSKVVSISLYIVSFHWGVVGPGMVTQVDMAAEKESLLYVVSTFTWKNREPTREV